MRKSWQQNIAVTVDIALFAKQNGATVLLLIQRGRPPFAGMWALPGGFVDANEELEAAALRELAEETGVVGISLQQWKTFGTPGRDPRGRTVSIVYIGVTDEIHLTPKGGDDAAAAKFFPLHQLPALAFDHQEIINASLKYLENCNLDNFIK